MSTPTPRTDAQEWTETNRSNAVVLASFARTLERELAQAWKGEEVASRDFRMTLADLGQARRELATERAKTADCGLTIASLCDGILGEDFADRSDQMLIRVGCRMKAELATERQKVRALTEILESICEEWGRNYNTNPIGAGQRMETLASKMLEKLEDEA